MKHSRKRSSRLFRALPVINKGLSTIGSTATNVTKRSMPLIEQGVSKVYGTMATGLDLGVKGAKSLRRFTKRTTGLRSSSKSLSGGRRSRRRHSRRRY
jgi:hypothetical protein